MGVSDFSSNYTDRSNDYGFQFEFQCQKCGNGFLTDFKASKMGIASGILRAATSFFGGRGYGAARAGEHLKDALRGQAWDAAFREAVEQCKHKFKQCGRCGKWVCPERCWNPKHKLCEGCAPELGEEAAALKAQREVEALRDGAEGPEIQVCSACGHENENAKFCGDCGKPLQTANWACPKCQAKVSGDSKFCGSCGTKRA